MIESKYIVLLAHRQSYFLTNNIDLLLEMIFRGVPSTTPDIAPGRPWTTAAAPEQAHGAAFGWGTLCSGSHAEHLRQANERVFRHGWFRLRVVEDAAGVTVDCSRCRAGRLPRCRSDQRPVVSWRVCRSRRQRARRSSCPTGGPREAGLPRGEALVSTRVRAWGRRHSHGSFTATATVSARGEVRRPCPRNRTRSSST